MIVPTAKRSISPATHLVFNTTSHATAQCYPIRCPNWNSRRKKVRNMVKIPADILSYFGLFPLFLLVCIVLTGIITIPAIVFDLWVGWINHGILGAAYTPQCKWYSGFLRSWSNPMLDSLCSSQLCSLLIGLSKSPWLWSKCFVFEMHSGTVCSSLSARWRSNQLVQWTFDCWILLLGCSFVHKEGDNGNLLVNFNAVARSCWTLENGLFDNLFILWNVSYHCHLLVMRMRCLLCSW